MTSPARVTARVVVPLVLIIANVAALDTWAWVSIPATPARPPAITSQLHPDPQP